MEIRQLFISPGHNFVGHQGQKPGLNPAIEVERVECVAGRGLRGDRFFDFKNDYKGQVTFFAEETYAALSAEFSLCDKSASDARRNVITAGVDLNTLIGETFEVQGVQFRGIEECRPCSWMDEAFAPGAERFLSGRGGLRARILTDGELRVASAAGSNLES